MAQDKKVDATLTMSEGQVAFGIGYSWGKGVLTYEGKEYPFKVSGLSVVDVGITKATSAGKVFNLKKLEDFNGNYTAGSAEGTVAGGAGVLTMKNQNGVEIELVFHDPGRQPEAGARGREDHAGEVTLPRRGGEYPPLASICKEFHGQKNFGKISNVDRHASQGSARDDLFQNQFHPSLCTAYLEMKVKLES